MSLCVWFALWKRCQMPAITSVKRCGVCKYSVGWGFIAVHSFNSLKINWYVTFDFHCWITLMTLMWQTQFSQLGRIRVRSHFVPPVIILLIAPCDCTGQLKWISLPSSSPLFCHQIVVSFVEHHGCPGSLFVFCSTLSGAVESNNCVSCCVIMRCSLFLSGLYWNLDPVPLQWLSPSVSEELMVSPSPCEFPPLQLNYPFSPYCSLTQLSIFPLRLHYLLTLSLPHRYISSILHSLSSSATFPFLSPCHNSLSPLIYPPQSLSSTFLQSTSIS